MGTFPDTIHPINNFIAFPKSERPLDQPQADENEAVQYTDLRTRLTRCVMGRN
jgi:hypothetical protein